MSRRGRIYANKEDLQKNRFPESKILKEWFSQREKEDTGLQTIKKDV